MLYTPPRLRFPKYGALMALSASCRSTCPRARVGSALFDSGKRVAAMGYNGVPSGQPHCDAIGCIMVDGHCNNTVHAEKSAKGTLNGRKLPGGYAFVTHRPCRPCFDEMVDLEVTTIGFLIEYRPNDDKEYIERVCREKAIEFEQLPFDIKELLKEMLTFHQGPGGLLIQRPWLKVSEDAPY